MNMTRLILFYIGCIGLRAWLTWFTWKHATEYPMFLWVLFAAISVGFATLYLFDLRQKNATETFGESEVWWNHLRPVHSVLYALAAMYVFKGNKHAYVPLLLDVIIGFVATTHHNFKRTTL